MGDMPEKIYLGDAVYAAVDDLGGLMLTTEDGVRSTNTIFLEFDTVRNLLLYIEKIHAASGKS